MSTASVLLYQVYKHVYNLHASKFFSWYNIFARKEASELQEQGDYTAVKDYIKKRIFTEKQMFLSTFSILFMD